MAQSNKKVLLCKKIIFHSPKDQEAFWEWIKKISAIDEIVKKEHVIFLHLNNSRVNNHTLDNLLGLFYRYNLEMTQLARFLNGKNKSWFYDNKKAYWHKKVFGTQTSKKR